MAPPSVRSSSKNPRELIKNDSENEDRFVNIEVAKVNQGQQEAKGMDRRSDHSQNSRQSGNGSIINRSMSQTHNDSKISSSQVLIGALAAMNNN